MDFNSKILEEEFLQSDEEEKTLRPSSLNEFIGQSQIKENLQVFIKAAQDRKSELDHVLLYGPPGLGKTSIAQIVAKELGVNIRSTSGPILSKAGDLAAILTNLEERDVLFIDASQHFEKVKTQNVLRAEDIQKIINMGLILIEI